MKRIAIVISTQSGHTKKVAEFLADQLIGKGIDFDLFNVELGQTPSAKKLKSYDAVVIGCPVYLGDFSQRLLDWTWDHREDLSELRCGLFTVSMNAADPRSKAREVDDKVLKNFLRQTDFHPRFVASFAGALAYTKYNFFKRCVLQGISAAAGGPTDTSQDYELTNWDEVSRFMAAFEAQDMDSDFATINRFPNSPQPLFPVRMPRVA
jgi:menaquinone-dependent protoporphyrinogen oxidase